MKHCPHCGHMVSDRTFRRHSQIYFKSVDLDSSCSEEDDISPDVSTNGDTTVEQQAASNTDNEFGCDSDSEDSGKVEEKWEDESDIDDFENKQDCDLKQDRDKYSAIAACVTIFINQWTSAYNVSYACIATLLKFLHALFVVCSNILPEIGILSTLIPRTLYQLNKASRVKTDNFIKYVVCPKCNSIRLYDECTVSHNGTVKSDFCSYRRFPNHKQRKQRRTCGTQLLKEVTLKTGKKTFYPRKTYCYKPIGETLKELVSRKNFWETCEKWRGRKKVPGTYRDVYDGRVWKTFQNYNEKPFLSQPGCFGLILNLDWWQPFKYSSYSVGCLYAAILNLPREIRYQKENIVLIGILPGPHEPRGDELNHFLRPLVDELLLLWDEGVQCELPSGIHQTCFAAVLCCASDVPAARKLSGFLSHNARLGCSKCLKEFDTGGFGESTNYGGFDRSFPRRSMQAIRKQLDEIEDQQTQTAKTKLQSKYGVRYSELTRLPYLDLVQFTVFDPMHNLFLGTAKTMLKTIWPNLDGLGEKSLDEIQAVVDASFSPPEIGRLPNKLAGSFGALTSQQLKNWTLYFSLYAVEGQIPEGAYKCWQLFVDGCHDLCRPVITTRQLRSAHEKLHQFCRTFERLYGSANCYPNQHFHLHLLECVLDFGPIYGFWLFSFERLNGILGSYQTNQKSIEVQLCRRFLREQHISAMQTPSMYADQLSAKAFGLDITGTLPDEATHAIPDYDHFVTVSSGALKTGYDLYDPSSVIMNGTQESSSLESDDIPLLLTSLECLVGKSEVKRLTQSFIKCSAVNYMGEQYGCRDSHLYGRCCRILADWCGTDGQIDTAGHGVRPGEIDHFLQFHFEDRTKGWVPIVMAKISWLQKHGDHDYFRSSLAKVWCRSLYEIHGPASYMPVQRIFGKYVGGVRMINREKVCVVIPKIPSFHW